ncbi:MAG: BON domain-containing protein [Rickettsiales bacterium]|jgi:osmotically-inducible protein OsmY|nr:BON domain-containing protein [Rickettsiales bacterium]
MKGLLILLMLSSCVESVVIGTIVTGTAITQTKKELSDRKYDDSIKKTLLNSFELENEGRHYKNINVNVFDGRIMLTGYVAEEKYKKLAVKKASIIKLGNEIIDEVIVVPTYSSHSFFNNDNYLSGLVWTKLKLLKEVDSINYDYNIVGGVVYVIGIAKSQKELVSVTNAVATINGVNRVVSYIKIK